MQWQLGILGTISAFAFGHRETKKNLCRDGENLCRDVIVIDFPLQQWLHERTSLLR